MPMTLSEWGPKMQVEAVTMILEHGLPSRGLQVTARVYGVRDKPDTYWANSNCYLILPDDLHIQGNGYVGYIDNLPASVIPKILDHYMEAHDTATWRTPAALELSALAGFSAAQTVWMVNDNRDTALDYSRGSKHNWMGGR